MPHTMKAFDKELAALKEGIAVMGSLSLEMVSGAVGLLSSGSAEGANEIILRDRRLDELQRSVEEQAIVTIARRQPAACDLRHIIGAIRIAGYLERVGDYAKNIAKRLRKVAQPPLAPEALVMAEPLGKAAHNQLRRVLDAYEKDDAVAAEAVWREDAGLGATQEAALKHVLSFMAHNPRSISSCANLLFCYKNLERIGDYATNIAESVVYTSTGQVLGERPKGEPSQPA